MATLTAQEWLKLSKETSSYNERYQNILSYFTQAAEQQTEQISQKYSADISGAYANYLSQQRALAEYPGLASGTLARLTEQGLSDYSAAYSAYKAKEAEDIYSASTKLGEKLTTALGDLDEQASMWAEAAKSLEESVLSYAVGTADEAAILSDNDAERLRAYNRILTGATYKGEGTEKQTFLDYLHGQNPDLYDELYYSGYGNELTSILSGVSGVNLADTEAVENYARGLEIESLRETLIKDLKGEDLEISPDIKGTEKELTAYKHAVSEAKLKQKRDKEFETATGISADSDLSTFDGRKIALSESKSTKSKIDLVDEGYTGYIGTEADSKIAEEIGLEDKIKYGVIKIGDVIQYKGDKYIVDLKKELIFYNSAERAEDISSQLTEKQKEELRKKAASAGGLLR